MIELADSLVHSRGLTHQARQLEKRGLLRRDASPDDNRGVEVTITADGRSLLAAVMPGHLKVVGRLLDSLLTHSDLRGLSTLIDPVRAHLCRTTALGRAAT